MPGGRPLKWNLDQYQTEIIALYTEGLSSTKVLKHLEDEYGIQVPDRTLKRRLREWNIQKVMPHRDADKIRPRLKAFWEVGLEDDDMYNILRQEGYMIKRGTVVRMRSDMGLKRRLLTGDKVKTTGQAAVTEASSSTAAAPKTAPLPPPQTQPSASTRVEVVEDNPNDSSYEEESEAEDLTDEEEEFMEAMTSTANEDANTNLSPMQMRSSGGVPEPVVASGSKRKAPADPDRPKRQYIKRKTTPRKPYTRKAKPVIIDNTPDAEKIVRLQDENEEMRHLMEALREEADESKAKMLQKAKDDAQKYRQIKQLESELLAQKTMNERLVSSAGGRDERIIQITTAKNTEIERIKNQLIETRAVFRDAAVRVFKYQRNCSSFLDNLRTNDPQYSAEKTEAELLTVDLERVFTEAELRTIRTQI